MKFICLVFIAMISCKSQVAPNSSNNLAQVNMSFLKDKAFTSVPNKSGSLILYYKIEPISPPVQNIIYYVVDTKNNVKMQGKEIADKIYWKSDLVAAVIPYHDAVQKPSDIVGEPVQPTVNEKLININK